MRDLSWIATAVFFISVSSCTAMVHKYDSQIKIEELKLEQAKIECNQQQKKGE